MAYYFEFDYGNGILRCTLEGDVTDESLSECYEAARKYAALNPGVVIAEFSNVVSFKVSAETVRDLIRRPPAVPGPCSRFLVAPSPHIYGLARMFQQYGSETRPQMDVVHSVDEAYTSLGVRELHFEPLNGAVPIRKRPALVKKAEA